MYMLYGFVTRWVGLTIGQGCSLGLEVSISRRSRDLFFKGLGLGKSWWVSALVSSRTENQTSRSRLGLEAQGLVYK